ncbi:hypothetical protein ACOMHN_024391 [Nucella lapillus]
MAVRVLTAFVDFQWCWCVLVLLWTPCFVRSGQYDNVALDKTCTMSSTWSGPPWRTETPRGVSLAVDGSIDATSTAEGCVHTGYEDRNCSWQVDLGRPFSIHRMVSWGRTDLCDDGRYGQECRQSCGQGCSNTCDKVTGTCFCSPGWQPSYCLTACPAGSWGQNCQLKCSANCADVGDNVTGQCSCKPGWRGSTCELECGQGSYGQDCQLPCGNCEQGTLCHHVTGHCPRCQDFYDLPFCTECVDYKYGSGCRQDCSENCQDVCNKVQGHCTCNAGWQEPRCVQECAGGTYGLRCEEKCGNCSDGRTSCDHVTGSYPLGCLSGWSPPLCQLALQQSAEDRGGGDVGPIVGAVVGVIVIAAVVVFIVIIIRRRGGFRAKSATEEPLDTPPSAIVNGGSNNRKRKQASFPNRDDIYQNVTVDPQDSGEISDGAIRGGCVSSFSWGLTRSCGVLSQDGSLPGAGHQSIGVSSDSSHVLDQSYQTQA